MELTVKTLAFAVVTLLLKHCFPVNLTNKFALNLIREKKVCTACLARHVLTSEIPNNFTCSRYEQRIYS